MSTVTDVAPYLELAYNLSCAITASTPSPENMPVRTRAKRIPKKVRCSLKRSPKKIRFSRSPAFQLHILPKFLDATKNREYAGLDSCRECPVKLHGYIHDALTRRDNLGRWIMNIPDDLVVEYATVWKNFK